MHMNICLSSQYLQGLLEGWVHRVLLDSSLALSLGGSVGQQIGLDVPSGQTQTGQGDSSVRGWGGCGQGDKGFRRRRIRPQHFLYPSSHGTGG